MIVSHLAGPVVEYNADTEDNGTPGPLVRQRCQWCGAILVDIDVSRISVAVQPGAEDINVSVPTWEVNRFVDVLDPDRHGGVFSLNPWTGIGPIPRTACLRMPPMLTA